MKKEMFLAYVIIIVLVILIIYFLVFPNNKVVDFQSCVNVGNSITESYPRQCKDSSGKVFTEEVVNIESNFGNKIVYSSDDSSDIKIFEEDCRKRGGTFNECGTICPPKAQFCVQVCAFTCEKIN